MEITQILLTITVLVLTTILALIGVEVFLIFREVRESVRKTNKILDDAGLISESVAKPLAGLSDLASGIKHLIGFLKSSPEEKKEKEQELSKESSRRYFLRSGKKLS